MVKDFIIYYLFLLIVEHYLSPHSPTITFLGAFVTHCTQKKKKAFIGSFVVGCCLPGFGMSAHEELLSSIMKDSPGPAACICCKSQRDFFFNLRLNKDNKRSY